MLLLRDSGRGVVRPILGDKIGDKFYLQSPIKDGVLKLYSEEEFEYALEIASQQINPSNYAVAELRERGWQKDEYGIWYKPE